MNVLIEPLRTVVSVSAAASVIADSLFGVGLVWPLVGLHAALVDTINVSGLPVYALDAPSGLNDDTGQPPVAKSPVIQVRVTITFLAIKPSLLTGDGRDAFGDIVLTDLRVM